MNSTVLGSVPCLEANQVINMIEQKQLLFFKVAKKAYDDALFDSINHTTENFTRRGVRVYFLCHCHAVWCCVSNRERWMGGEWHVTLKQLACCFTTKVRSKAYSTKFWSSCWSAHYLTAPNLSAPNGLLTFWKRHEKLCPRISQLARILPSSSASSVPVECMFSTAGLIANSKRSSLSADKLHKICFISGALF